MKITKYEHACLVIEEVGGKRPVIDPGSFTTSLPPDLDNVVAIVITHVHQDHLDKTHIQALKDKNPNVKIFGTAEVAEELKPLEVEVVNGGDSTQVLPFDLKFYGGQHAQIHPSWPANQNVGVMVNDKLYYPGDSFTEPHVPVELLGLPVSAPWLKIAEAMDYLSAVKPTAAFPTHNAILSDQGEGLAERILGDVAKNAGTELKFIKPGNSVEV